MKVNIEINVIFVINYVKIDITTVIFNQEFKLVIFVKNNK